MDTWENVSCVLTECHHWAPSHWGNHGNMYTSPGHPAPHSKNPVAQIPPCSGSSWQQANDRRKSGDGALSHGEAWEIPPHSVGLSWWTMSEISLKKDQNLDIIYTVSVI